jgi:sulfatase maturation enzyme AslB (radical SAM superfamily)
MEKNIDTFCPLLFQHLATHPHGGVTHCCMADHRNNLSASRDDYEKYYNLNRDSISEIMNSKSFRTARLQSLNGEFPAACVRCKLEEESGIKSKRLREREDYPEYTPEVARNAIDDEGYIKDVQLEFIELRLGNVCNLACRTCNPGSSSRWRNDYDKLQKSLAFDITSYPTSDEFRWPEKQELWEDFIPHCRDVKKFYINGGEPTLSKQHFIFLQKLVDLGKTDVKLWYNINMTDINEEVIQLWKKFDEVKISCSIDDLGKRNDYIRHPSTWDKILKNFLRLKEENFELEITQTVSWMNYFNLDKFYDFFQNKHNVFVVHNFVYDPNILSPAVMPKHMRDEAHARFESTLDDQFKLNELKSRFSGPDNNSAWERAKEYTQKLDAIKQQNIADYLPEFNGII